MAWCRQATSHYPSQCWPRSTPFAKSNGRFFSDTKMNMMPSSNLYDFWWVHKMHVTVHFVQNILTFCINPFCTGVLNAVSVTFFKSSLNIIGNFLLKLVGFKLNFLNFKHDTFSLSHPNVMAIGLTVTKPSANKCRSLCKLISNSMHANLGQTNDGIAMKLRYHWQEWVLHS